MLNAKALIGTIPSYAITRLIQGAVPSVRAAQVVDFINSYPNWFESIPRRFLVNTHFDFSIWCDRFDVIGQAIIRNGQWEGLLSRTISTVLSPGDVAIDVGANIGYDTMLMSKAVGATGFVVAFEPEVANLAQLLENIRQLPYSNVLVQSIGVGDKPCIARIAASIEGNAGTANLRPGQNGATKPLIVGRIDSILPSVEFKKISLVKIDIEGLEYKAILGMGELLDNVEVLTCEIDPRYLQQCGTSPSAIFELMTSRGFSSYCAQPNSNAKWQRSGPNFQINVKESFHFDAMFCRSMTPALQALIEE